MAKSPRPTPWPDRQKDPGGYTCHWINQLTHTKGKFAREPFNLRPWQVAFLKPLFGTMNDEGKRRYRTAYCELPRKSGKSEIAAAVALYMLLGDNEQGGEVYCLDPATRILYADDLSWRPIGDARVGDSLFAVDEMPPEDQDVERRRRMRKTKILRVEHRKAFRIRLTMANGQALTCTPNHRWWVRPPRGTGQGWRRAGQLDRGWRIRCLGMPWQQDMTHGAGYLAALFDGEGYIHRNRSTERGGFRIGFAQKPGAVLDRGVRELHARGYPTTRGTQMKGTVDWVCVSGLYQVLRFLGEIRPVRLLPRHEEVWTGMSTAKGFHDIPIERIEFLHEGPVVDIETEDRTFLAEGFVSHNSAACDLEQASIAFNVAAQMVRNDPELSKVLEIIPSRRRIIHHKTGSFYRAIPADEASAHGYNASAIVCDELHAWKTRKLWDVLTTSTGAREQPLIFVITTAGWDRTSICWEQHEYARKVRDGIIDDPTFLPVLYQAPDDADWEDEAVWRRCNPALGDFRSLDEMKMMAGRAREVPAQQNSFRRLYLCQWTSQLGRALDMRLWDEANEPVDLESFTNQTCYAGLDLATKEDIAALALVFPRPGGRYAVIPRFWIPEQRFSGTGDNPRDPHLTEILQEWARLGFITQTPGRVIDYDRIHQDILDLNRRVNIQEINVDPWNATQLENQLKGDGFTVIETRQGFGGMANPTKDFLKLVAGRQLDHGGHPVLRWMADNFAVAEDAQGNLKPDRATSSEKIDGIVATILALDRALRNPAYDDSAPVILGPPRTSWQGPI